MVTGPSGVGKGTLTRGLLRRVPGLALSVSATTRGPRPGEVDGRDYYFLTPEEFRLRLSRGEFLESASYAGNCYGTLYSELDRAVDGLVLEIEIEGARRVRSLLSDVLAVFIAPPSLEALEERLVGRGLDSQQQIEDRLEVARAELQAREEFSHVIINDRIDEATAELVSLVATMWELAPEENTQ